MLSSWSSGTNQESGQREDPDFRQLHCAGCGNRCRLPGTTTRAYACPRCGQHLALPKPDGQISVRPTHFRLRVSGAARAFLSGVLLMGAMAAAIYAGLSGYRAAAAGREAARPGAILLRLSEAEQRNYAFRQRQLEEDLQRDTPDFEVLVVLGQLNLQLAASQVEDRRSHLRRARHYLLCAGQNLLSRGDAFRVHALLEAANAPNPTFALADLPGEVGPPLQDEDEIRMHLGWLESELRFHLLDSRFLRRLADNYMALYSVMDRREGSHLEPWEAQSPLSDPREVRRQAAEYYRRAIACARTREALSRALYREAEMYRVINQPSRAAALLEQLLRIQPNNWLVSLEAAALCRQLGQPAQATRYQAQSARWRTPGWI